MSTPLCPHTLASHKAAGSKTVDPRVTTCFMFDRLAPLDAPKFIMRTPQTKVETEAYLRRQTATLAKLKLADLDHSDDEFSLDPPPCHLDDEMDGFISTAGTGNGGYKLLSSRGKDKEEVAEAVSPGGHVIKRRARSRPVSADLLESVLHPSPMKVNTINLVVVCTDSL
jgi:mitosis inhibitor protein kinase SWE1